jgi:hypothetical protein
MIKFIFKAFEATTLLGARLWSILGRVYDFFVKLDHTTDGWSTKIIAFIAIWKSLNLAFLATPLGMILTGLVAILALYDDFKVWQEGGQSLFDWAKFLPAINAVKSALKAVYDVVKDVIDAILGVGFAIAKLASGDTASAFDFLKDAGLAVKKIFTDLIDVFKNVGAAAADLGGLLYNYFAKLLGGQQIAEAKGGDFASSIAKTLGANAAAPALASVQQAQPLRPATPATNHNNVSQETNITVQGSADANATGKAVANEQSKVNFDLTRNMRGATR